MAFSLESRIGRGRIVETFAAKLEVGKDSLAVVVKRPRAELAANEAFVSAFVEWGQKEKEVDHENVVAVLEAGKTADGPYVIQEKIAGVPLSEVLVVLRKQKRTISLALALAIGARIAKALAHLHELRSAHGGVDTGEVLISYEGDVKLGDQRLHTLDAIARLDGLGSAGGPALAGRDPQSGPAPENDLTPIYRAPELAEKPGASSPAGDVYSAALIVLEMMIGHRVWTAASMTVEASVRALEDFSHVGQAQPELTSELVDILHTSTLMNPVDRVPSAKDLHGGLARVIQKYQLTVQSDAIAAFVRAVVPPPAADAAPTMMVDPAKAEELAKTQKKAIALLEGASVKVDPDVERKALSRVAPPEGAPTKPAAAPAKAPVASRRPSSRAIGATAKPAPGVAPQWQIWAGIGLIVLIVAMMFIHMATRTGDDIRLVQVTAISDPPNAIVYLDGQQAGRTPLETSHSAKKGKVQLRFSLDGYETHEITIETKQDELRYEARLKKLPESK